MYPPPRRDHRCAFARFHACTHSCRWAGAMPQAATNAHRCPRLGLDSPDRMVCSVLRGSLPGPARRSKSRKERTPACVRSACMAVRRSLKSLTRSSCSRLADPFQAAARAFRQSDLALPGSAPHALAQASVVLNAGTTAPLAARESFEAEQPHFAASCAYDRPARPRCVRNHSASVLTGVLHATTGFSGRPIM